MENASATTYTRGTSSQEAKLIMPLAIGMFWVIVLFVMSRYTCFDLLNILNKLHYALFNILVYHLFLKQVLNKLN